MLDQLTDAQWHQFETEGHLRLGRVVSNKQLGALRQRIDEIMLGAADIDYSRLMMQLDPNSGVNRDLGPQTKGHKVASLNYRKIQGLELDPLFFTYMQKPLFRHICARAYGSGTAISFYRAMLMNKPASKGTHLPWHQDVYDFLDRQPQVTVWLALDDSTIDKGCVKIIPRSHHQMIAQDLSDEQVETLLADQDATCLECGAGEAFLLHNYLAHSSDVNQTDQPRRAFSVCYLDAATRANDGRTFSVIFGAE